ncbi:MAG: ATP-binding protein, partial [Candidatus Rokuibacteriota bacterium]
PPGERRAAPVPTPDASEAPHATRRVTLLQARLLPAGIEPADWNTGRALEATAAKLRSFGGRIEELAPSGVLATFGLEPDEDAPRRAAHAAVAVQTLAARAQSDVVHAPGVKIALHTTTMPVTFEGDAVDVGVTAMLEARRTLAALLEAAEPGSVVATAATGRFLARRFDLLPLPAVDAAIAGAFQVVRHSDPGRTRFVGRERELRLLAERFELAQAGQGQVVTIVGEAGIGKSRLLYELRRRLGRSATWVEGHALSFGRAMPFHAVIDMLRRVFRVGDADTEAAIVDKLGRGVRRLGADAGGALPFVRYLLSVDPGDPAVLTMDPRLRHAAIVRASHLLLKRGAELRPHVIVLEDMHWCDPATEDWITRLADGIAGKRVLVLATCRPGYRPPFGGRSFHTGLALATLSGEESAGVTRGLLGVEELPSALQAFVVDKAEGNPFFIEELVRSLEELGAVRRAGERLVVSARLDQVAVPDTIEEVVLARIRRLEEPLQRLLEVASVIGKNVPFPLLRAVTAQPDEKLGAGLDRLQAAEFLYEARAFPELEHTFKHALTHDVAYGGVKAAERRDLHARIVRAIESLYRDRLGEHVDRLAYHAVRGELWPEAVGYSRQAGAKAFDRSANREAVSAFEQTLVALARLPERRETLETAIDVRLALRSALLQLGELRKITQYLREAESLATTLDDRRRLAWVWTYMTTAYVLAGDPARALAVGERALAAAEEVGDVGLRATARTPLAHACYESGAYHRAIDLLSEALRALAGDLVRERFGQAMPPSLYARSLAAICLAELGEFHEASRLATESADLAETLDLPFGLVLARIALAYAALVEGRLADAERAADRALDVIRVRGIPTWFPWAAAVRGYALTLSGRAAEAVVLLEQARERAVALPFLFGHSQWLAWLAHAHLLAGHGDVATPLASEALELSRQRGERGYEAWALFVLGEVEARRELGASPPAERLRKALALATELGMKPLIARCQSALRATAAP